MPVLSSAVPASPWKMRREELVTELESYQVPVHPQWTVPEIRQSLIEQREIRFPRGEANPATGLTKLKLEELLTKAAELEITVPAKPTRGVLLKLIREAVQPPGDHVMTFGKYRSWLYKEVPESYMDWSIREVRANSNASPDLKLFAKWAQTELSGRQARMKKSGTVLATDDPEVKAVVEPPDVASVVSWKSSVSQGSSRRSPGKDKRQLEEEIEAISAMQSELSEEAQAELAELEMRLAALKQKHHIPPRGYQQ